MKNPISSQAWDDMTDEQKIEWLAKEVMGWHSSTKRYGIYRWLNQDNKFMDYQSAVYDMCDDHWQLIVCWDPLEDHNNFHDLEKKVMEDARLSSEYSDQLSTMIEDKCTWEADLPTRCKALYLAKKCSQSYSEQISKGSIDEDYFAHGPDITPIELAKMTGARKQVFDIMIDGEWRHLQQIQDKMFDFAPEQSIGIYLRSFREPKYGGYKVEKRKLSPARVFEYRVSSPIL